MSGTLLHVSLALLNMIFQGRHYARYTNKEAGSESKYNN